MKWLSFTGLCVVGLVALGILAVDERNVVWEAGQPLCPYCRSAMEPLAITCKGCRGRVDWVGTTLPCSCCLDSPDVDHLRDRFDALALPPAAAPPWLAAFPGGYFHVMDRGACGYCAGLKQIGEGGEARPCPICRGDGRCILCGGDRVVEVGNEQVHRRLLERRREWEEGERREKLTRLALQRDRLVDRDVGELRGFLEAASIRDGEGRLLVERAREQLAAAFAALAHEHDLRLGASKKAAGEE